MRSDFRRLAQLREYETYDADTMNEVLHLLTEENESVRVTAAKVLPKMLPSLLEQYNKTRKRAKKKKKPAEKKKAKAAKKPKRKANKKVRNEDDENSTEDEEEDEGEKRQFVWR